MRAVMISGLGERSELTTANGKLCLGKLQITGADLAATGCRIISDDPDAVCELLGLASDDSRITIPPDPMVTQVGGEVAD